MYSTTAETIQALGISKVRLNELARAGKVPRGPAADQWDLSAVRVALGRNMDVRHVSPARGDQPAAPPQREQQLPRGSLAHAQLIHEQAKAAKASLEAQRLEGKLIDRDAVERNWADIAVQLQNAVMGLPAQIVNRLPAEWRHDILIAAEDEARRVLTALSNEIRSIPQAT